MLVSLAGLPGPRAEPALTGELALRAEVRQRVIDSLHKDDFAALEAMAKTYREQQSRTGSGVWKLALFYGAINESARAAGTEKDRWSVLAGKMRRWLDLYPSSPTPYVANGIVMKRYAWSLRPRRLVIDVSVRPEEIFVVAIEAAASFLDANRTIARRDPHFYVVRADLAAALALPSTEFVALIEEGLAWAPGYVPIMFSGMDYFAPERAPDGRLGDGRPLEAFANMMQARAGGEAGLELYARLYWHAHATVYGKALFRDSNVDWRKMSAGMDVILARNPDTWNISNFTGLACLVGDRAKARALLDRLKTPAIPQVWETEADFATCRDWARSTQAGLNHP